MKTVDDIIKYITPKQMISDLIAENSEQKSIIESLKITVTEKERIIGKLIDEILALRGGLADG